MNDSAASLDRLHDVVVPKPVPLWPPAPGWYAVIAVVTCGLVWSGYRRWKRWRADAYRRAALQELAAVKNCAGVAQLLRRVALVVAPRREVAAQTGENWPTWLAARCPESMPQVVREQLANGVYREAQPAEDVSELKSYAASWMSRHRNEPGSLSKTQSESAD